MFDYTKHCTVIGRWVVTFTNLSSGTTFLSRSQLEIDQANKTLPGHVVTRPGKKKITKIKEKDIVRYQHEHGDWTVRHYCGKKDSAIDLNLLRDKEILTFGSIVGRISDQFDQSVPTQIEQHKEFIAILSASPVLFGNKMKRRGRDHLIGQKCPKCNEEVPAGLLWIITSKKMK